MASSQVSLAGKKFGRLEVIGRPFKTVLGLTANTRCTCGREKAIPVGYLLNKRANSCGCLRKEVSAIMKSGGLGAVRAYKSFTSMRQRTGNPKSVLYSECGGSGIGVCPEWAFDFTVFWKDLGAPLDKQILARRDTRADYSPANCFWATYKESRNYYKPRPKTPLLVAA